MANVQESLNVIKSILEWTFATEFQQRGKLLFPFDAFSWARNHTSPQSQAEESVLPVLLAPAPSQMLKEKTKTKTKAPLFWAGPHVAMDPKQTPAALLPAGLPFWEGAAVLKWLVRNQMDSWNSVWNKNNKTQYSQNTDTLSQLATLGGPPGLQSILN